MHIERLAAGYEPQNSAKQHRNKRQSNEGGKQPEAACYENGTDESHLTGDERQSLPQFLVHGYYAAGADAQLNEVNLISGEQPVRQPKCKSDVVEFARRDIIRACRR